MTKNRNYSIITGLNFKRYSNIANKITKKSENFSYNTREVLKTMSYTVKEIAQKMGMTEHTIRFYTDQGLLPCRRDKNNHRIFDEESVSWLTSIQCLRRCGILIEDIQIYCRLCQEGDARLPERYEFMLRQRELAYTRLKEAQEAFHYMENKIRHYEDIMSNKIPDDMNMVFKNMKENRNSSDSTD